MKCDLTAVLANLLCFCSFLFLFIPVNWRAANSFYFLKLTHSHVGVKFLGLQKCDCLRLHNSYLYDISVCLLSGVHSVPTLSYFTGAINRYRVQQKYVPFFKNKQTIYIYI